MLIQSCNSALHFNSAEGFGEWRILISARADGDLREARRKDRKSFAIIVKKIKCVFKKMTDVGDILTHQQRAIQWSFFR